jgi:hypothetical protein
LLLNKARLDGGYPCCIPFIAAENTPGLVQSHKRKVQLRFDIGSETSIGKKEPINQAITGKWRLEWGRCGSRPTFRMIEGMNAPLADGACVQPARFHEQNGSVEEGFRQRRCGLNRLAESLDETANLRLRQATNRPPTSLG